MAPPATRSKRKHAGSEGIKDLLVEEGARAVAVLVSIMCDEEQKAELRMKAAESILDRACGKPGTASANGSVGTGEIAVRFEGELAEWSK